MNHSEPLRDRAQGRWPAILNLLGMDKTFLTGKNGPCVFCGGKDRWRFIDREGSGNWICSQCGKGDGIALVQRLLNTDFRTMAERVEAVLGQAKIAPARRPVPREVMKKLWDASKSLCGTPGEAYLGGRAIRGRGSLRWLPRASNGLSGPSGDFGSIVAQIASPQGRCVNLYRIFVTEDGKKAPLDKPKRAMRAGIPPGSAVRLCLAGPVLGIAEGIENALSASQMFGTPTWATLGTASMESFAVPEGVEELVIYGDNDASYAGQKAAYSRAHRAVVFDTIRARVEIPDQAGCDWNDVLAGSTARASNAASR